MIARALRLWLLVVFVAFAVLGAITHPSLYGYTCQGGPLCYAEVLLSPLAVADLPQLFHLVTTLAQMSALGWLLSGVVRRRRARHERGAAGAQMRRSLSEWLAHIVFALVAVVARIAFSTDFGLTGEPRFLHVVVMLLSATCAFFVASGFFFAGTGLDSTSAGEISPRSRLGTAALGTAIAVVLATCVFAFLQYDAGVFPCGAERSLCLDTGTSPTASFLATRVLLPSLAAVLSLVSFALGALRVRSGGSYEAFFIPWVALIWLAIYVGRQVLEPTFAHFAAFPLFAAHQLTAWVLVWLLIGLALRHTPR